MFFLSMPNPLLCVMAGCSILFLFWRMLGSASSRCRRRSARQFGAILLVPATYLALNLLEEYVAVPFIIGRRLLLNPVVLFIWLIFWGWLWGVPGA